MASKIRHRRLGNVYPSQVEKHEADGSKSHVWRVRSHGVSYQGKVRQHVKCSVCGCERVRDEHGRFVSR